MSGRKKWRREIFPPHKVEVIDELNELHKYWLNRRVALGVHPACEHHKILDRLVDDIRRTVLDLGGELPKNHPCQGLGQD